MDREPGKASGCYPKHSGGGTSSSITSGLRASEVRLVLLRFANVVLVSSVGTPRKNPARNFLRVPFTPSLTNSYTASTQRAVGAGCILQCHGV